MEPDCDTNMDADDHEHLQLQPNRDSNLDANIDTHVDWYLDTHLDPDSDADLDAYDYGHLHL
jgi:hypothetical protein